MPRSSWGQNSQEQFELISTIQGRGIVLPINALMISLGAVLLLAAPVHAAPWTQPGYLYRYFVWGAQRPFTSRSDDYKLYGYHAIENGPLAFHFAAANRDLVPGDGGIQRGQRRQASCAR